VPAADEPRAAARAGRDHQPKPADHLVGPMSETAHDDAYAAAGGRWLLPSYDEGPSRSGSSWR